jgi:KDO2-lipid IV(A) lauroyltransferase
MTLVSRLARKTGARVIIGYAQRLPQGEGFSLHFSKASDAIYDLSLEASVAALNKDVARCIREVPEQYQWSYKRFRTRPLGEQPVYT